MSSAVCLFFSSFFFFFFATHRTFLWCKCQTVHSTKMKIWHSDCHLCIYTCRFGLLHLSDSWFSLHPREGVQYFPEWTLLACLWPGTSGGRVGGGCYSLHFRCKCTVTLCQPSSSENKERSYGSSHHKAALQGRLTRRQEPSPHCVPFCLKSSSTSSSDVRLSFSVLLALSLQGGKKNPLRPKDTKWLLHLKRCKTADYVSDIFTMQKSLFEYRLDESQLKSPPPHVTCIAYCQKHMKRSERMFYVGALWSCLECVLKKKSLSLSKIRFNIYQPSPRDKKLVIFVSAKHKCEITGYFLRCAQDISSHVCGYKNAIFWWKIWTFRLCLWRQ